jgi:hypothetical protein
MIKAKKPTGTFNHDAMWHVWKTIFKLLSPPQFRLLWLIENGGDTHNFESGPPKDHFNSNF